MNNATRIRMWSLAFVVAVITSVAAALLYPRWVPSTSYRMDRLASAAPPVRMFEGRITNFPYRRVSRNSIRATATASFFEDSRNLAFIAARARVLGKELSVADDYYVAGIAHLLSGQSDAAVTALARALTMRAGIRDTDRPCDISVDHALLSDLSVAYLQRATSMSRASDYVRALHCADRAWQLRQTVETSWNRALALQRLHLYDDANETWQQYLQLEDASAWISEARMRTAELRRPLAMSQWRDDPGQLFSASRNEIEDLVRRFPLHMRRAAEKDILPQWAAAVLSGGSDKAWVCLQRLDWIGSALVRLSGESLMADVAANIRVVADQKALALAVKTVSEAKSDYDKGNGTACRTKLQAAIPELLRHRSPFVHYARFYIAATYYFDNDYASLRREAARLSDIPSRYAALRAQTSWVLGVGEMSTGRPDGALRHYEEAHAAFTRLGELDYVAAVHNLLAEAYEYLDSPDDVWMHRERALALVNDIGASSSQWVQLLQGSAQLLLANHQPNIAKILLDRTIKLPQTSADPLFHADTLCWQAVALHQLGRHAEAQAMFKHARYAADKIRVPAIRDRALSNVILTRALTVERDVTPSEVEAAVEFARNSGNRWALPRLLRLQADIRARNGDYARAMRGYRAAIDEIVTQRRATTLMRFELLNRTSLSDATDNAISLAMSRGDVAAAFEFSEYSSGAAFPTRASPTVTIPANVAIVKIVCLPTRMIIWMLTARGMTSRSVAIPAESIRTAATDISTSAAAARFIGESILYSNPPPAVDTLVFVPDAASATIRFEELIDPATGKRLIERYIIAQAPTVATYLRASSHTSCGHGALPLLVEGAQPGSMPRLPQAAEETRKLQRIYPSSVVWTSRSQSLKTLLPAVENAALVHFAAHGVVNRTNEFLSNIVLGDSDKLLYAHDIAALRLAGHPIVILSTCSGAATAESRRRRAPTLADAFLAAGASVVVATSGSIDDSDAKAFSLLLHERLSRGVPVGQAVRDIQLKYSNQGLSWSDFVVVGDPQATYVHDATQLPVS